MTAPGTKPGRSLPLAEWPLADRQQWLHRPATGKLSRMPQPQIRHRPATRYTLQYSYGQYLAWLTDAGKLDLQSTPASRITEPLILGYVATLQARLRAHSVLTAIESVDSMIAAISPGMDRKLLKAVITHLRIDAESKGAIERKLVPVRELYELGLELMGAAEEGASTPATAVLFRDGLLLALLAAVPLRRKNAYAIRIGKNLVWNGDEARLQFPADEMKNGKPYDAVCSRKLTRLLWRYVEIYRPALLARRSPSLAASEPVLWLNLEGSPLSYGGYYYIVTSRTQAKFGFPVTPHHFRRCAATSIAIENPKHVGIAAPILGHTDPRMTEAAYNLAGSISASRRHVDGIRAERRELRSKVRVRRGEKGRARDNSDID
jgi:integrase/recombinase XerD